jgi:hypothetical protein
MKAQKQLTTNTCIRGYSKNAIPAAKMRTDYPEQFEKEYAKWLSECPEWDYIPLFEDLHTAIKKQGLSITNMHTNYVDHADGSVTFRMVPSYDAPLDYFVTLMGGADWLPLPLRQVVEAGQKATVAVAAGSPDTLTHTVKITGTSPCGVFSDMTPSDWDALLTAIERDSTAHEVFALRSVLEPFEARAAVDFPAQATRDRFIATLEAAQMDIEVVK